MEFIYVSSKIVTAPAVRGVPSSGRNAYESDLVYLPGTAHARLLPSVWSILGKFLKGDGRHIESVEERPVTRIPVTIFIHDFYARHHFGASKVENVACVCVCWQLGHNGIAETIQRSSIMQVKFYIAIVVSSETLFSIQFERPTAPRWASSTCGKKKFNFCLPQNRNDWTQKPIPNCCELFQWTRK